MDECEAGFGDLGGVLAVGSALLDGHARVLDVAHDRGTGDAVDRGGDSARRERSGLLAARHGGGVGGNLASVGVVRVLRLHAEGLPRTDERAGLLIDDGFAGEVSEDHAILEDSQRKADGTRLCHVVFPFTWQNEKTTRLGGLKMWLMCAGFLRVAEHREKLGDSDRQAHSGDEPGGLE